MSRNSDNQTVWKAAVAAVVAVLIAVLGMVVLSRSKQATYPAATPLPSSPSSASSPLPSQPTQVAPAARIPPASAPASIPPRQPVAANLPSIPPALAMAAPPRAAPAYVSAPAAAVTPIRSAPPITGRPSPSAPARDLAVDAYIEWLRGTESARDQELAAQRAAELRVTEGTFRFMARIGEGDVDAYRAARERNLQVLQEMRAATTRYIDFSKAAARSKPEVPAVMARFDDVYDSLMAYELNYVSTSYKLAASGRASAVGQLARDYAHDTEDDRVTAQRELQAALRLHGLPVDTVSIRQAR